LSGNDGMPFRRSKCVSRPMDDDCFHGSGQDQLTEMSRACGKKFLQWKERNAWLAYPWMKRIKKASMHCHTPARVRFNGGAAVVAWSGIPPMRQNRAHYRNWKLRFFRRTGLWYLANLPANRDRWCVGITQRKKGLPFKVFKVQGPWYFSLSSLRQTNLEPQTMARPTKV
jgi:hypothetical protein